MISLVIADDHPAVRALLVKLVGDIPDCSVVGIAADGEAALQAVLLHRPDILLLDISMPIRSGLIVARMLVNLAPSTKILFVSGEGQEVVPAALDAGGCGFMNKAFAGEELETAIRSILAGKRYISESLLG